ncbi:MAG: YncE family protein [Alphaproteobacteria bacterium]
MKTVARVSLPAALAAAFLWIPCAHALDDVARYVFVPNRASADVAVIDSLTDRVVAHLDVGNVPHQVVVSESLNRLVATNTGDDTISIVDLETLASVATLRLDSEPEHMQLHPDGRLVAVGNIGGGTVSLVALDEAREVARIRGLFEPHNLTFSRDGSRLYVANLGANHVSVIDVAEARIIDEVPVAGPAAVGALGAAPQAYQGIINVTPTPDGRLGFAAHGEAGVLAVIDLTTGQGLGRIALGPMPWRAYATAQGRHMLVPNNGDATISVISTSSLEVVATLPGAKDMTGVNSDPGGTVAFVISRGEDKAVVLDLEAMAKVGEIPLPGSPETGVTTPDGRKLYVALSGSDRVAVIDVKTQQLLGMIDGVGEEPWGATMVGARNYCH